MTPSGRQILFINIAHSFCHYCLLILPTAVLAMAYQGSAFGPDYGPILALATGMFVLYGLFSLPQGWIAAKIGRKRLMTIYFFGNGLSMVTSGLVGTPMALGIALAATGFFAAIYHPIGTAMLVEAAGDKPGRALGLNGVSGNMGVALAPVVTAFLAAHSGWQTAFIVPGILCTLFGFVWMRTPEAVTLGHKGARPFPVIPRRLVRQAVVSLLLIAVVSGLVFNAFTLLLPKLMQERLATNPDLLPLVGAAAFIATLCGGLTQFTVGRMIDRTTLRRVFMPLGVVLMPALIGLAYVQGWLVLPVAAITAAVLFGQVTVNETMAARYIAPELRTRMYSIRFFVGFLGSAMAAPLVGGLHEMTGSLIAPVLVMAGFAAVTLCCALLFPDRPEELRPELWDSASALPAAAE